MFLLLIWIHWIADFVAQTDKMATLKSTSLKWLSIHISIYSIFFLPFGLKFAALNGISHFIVDFFTSRATRYLWKKGDRHNFFVIIGLDQALHLTFLYCTMGYI